MPQLERMEERIDTLERHEREQYAIDVKQDEQIKAMCKRIDRLYRVVCIAGLMMLYAIIYGAIGERGFNAVRKAYPSRLPTGDIVTEVYPPPDARIRILTA